MGATKRSLTLTTAAVTGDNRRMSDHREPVDPTEVYDSTHRSASDRIRAAADQVISGGARAADAARLRAESARSGVRDFADQPVDRVRSYSERARTESARIGDRAKSQAHRAAAPGGPVDWTETKINGLIAGIGTRLSDAVRTGKVDRVFQVAQEGVTKGAGQARRLLRR